MPSRIKKLGRKVRSSYKSADQARGRFQSKHPYVYAAGKMALNAGLRYGAAKAFGRYAPAVAQGAYKFYNRNHIPTVEEYNMRNFNPNKYFKSTAVVHKSNIFRR